MLDFTAFNACFVQATLRLCGQAYPEFFHAPSMEEEWSQTQKAQPPQSHTETSEHPPTLH